MPRGILSTAASTTTERYRSGSAHTHFRSIGDTPDTMPARAQRGMCTRMSRNKSTSSRTACMASVVTSTRFAGRRASIVLSPSTRTPYRPVAASTVFPMTPLQPLSDGRPTNECNRTAVPTRIAVARAMREVLCVNAPALCCEQRAQSGNSPRNFYWLRCLQSNPSAAAAARRASS